MANPKHLLILKSGRDIWNKWRRECDNIKPDFSGSNLKGLNLYKCNLINANLSGANLSGANLLKANLLRASLNGANLLNTNLSWTNLTNANLSYAYLKYAVLSKASLIETNLTKADLSNTIINSAYFKNPILDETDFTNANFYSAVLQNVTFAKTNLFGSIFILTRLNNVDFKESKIGSTIFGLTDLSFSKNLAKAKVIGECTIDFQTLRASKNLPKEFLFKIGMPENYIDYLPDFFEEKTIRLHPAFLSHSSIDKAFATKLYEELTRRRVRVWYDEKQLLPGDDIRHRIGTGINLYDKFILVCSEHSLKSWWVDEELDRAFEKKKNLFQEKGKHIGNIIPITIDDFVFNDWKSQFKSNINRMKIGDFRDWKNDTVFNKKVDELTTVLNADRSEDYITSFY